MKDLFIYAIEEELKVIEETANNLVLKITLLTQKIRYIFSQIKSCENIEAANGYFDILEKIQDVLATLIYKEGLGLSDSLFWFTGDFDRIDDKELREYIFKRIISGEYYFGKKLYK